ncbi:MAG TPA: hypothetical protein VGM18_14195 [Candidatus Sulfotelmatobacter sp.]|jgi:hypothetical protein
MKRLLKAAGIVIADCLLAFGQSSAGQSSPQIHLDADGLKPRPIEELTGTTIAHNYALAWRDMASALESSQGGGLGEEFVGVAKDRLMKRIADQRQTGVHVRIVDHGHQVKAIFYSTDGTAMQLVDEAQLEILTLDGNKLLDTANSVHRYVVLMTPGADRWYVRDLEETPAKAF